MTDESNGTSVTEIDGVPVQEFENAGLGPECSIVVLGNGLIYLRFYTDLTAFSGIFDAEGAEVVADQILTAARTAREAAAEIDRQMADIQDEFVDDDDDTEQDSAPVMLSPEMASA